MSIAVKKGMSGQTLKEQAKKWRGSAIKLFCIQCMGGVVGEPGWKAASMEARRCASTDCALHPHAYNRGSLNKGPPTPPKMTPGG